MFKKITLILTLICMVLTLASCSGDKKDGGAEAADGSGAVFTEGGKTVYYGGNDGSSPEMFKDCKTKLDPKDVYSSVEWEERMLYGYFNLVDGDDKVIYDFENDVQLHEVEYATSFVGESKTEKKKMSVLPIKLSVGTSMIDGIAVVARDYYWLEATFIEENGSQVSIPLTYTVSGNELTVYPLEYYREMYDDEFNVTGYEYKTGSKGFTYTFEMSGPELTLKYGDDSVRLLDSDFVSGVVTTAIGGIVADGSPSFMGIDTYHIGVSSSGATGYLTDKNGDFIIKTDYFARFTDDGHVIFRFDEKDEEGKVTTTYKEFVYFGGGTVLTDGEKMFYYTETITSRYLSRLSNGMSSEELSALATLTDAQIKEIAQKKEDLLTELMNAFKAEGISVSVDTATGEIAMDSSVLFGGDSAELTADGKAFLDKFMKVYTATVFSDKYKDFVSKTVVEGHAAPGSTYELGLALSEQRANNVKDYCLSAGGNASAMEAVGYSNTKPVYDDDGNVDKAASRRVSFRFVVNIG